MTDRLIGGEEGRRNESRHRRGLQGGVNVQGLFSARDGVATVERMENGEMRTMGAVSTDAISTDDEHTLHIHEYKSTSTIVYRLNKK